ncbi:MAG: hypothetical protein EXR75_07990 [Myxococcales bacterium]|nr:hypothetical protein [Myxococcales bacterium]
MLRAMHWRRRVRPILALALLAVAACTPGYAPPPQGAYPPGYAPPPQGAYPPGYAPPPQGAYPPGYAPPPPGAQPPGYAPPPPGAQPPGYAPPPAFGDRINQLDMAFLRQRAQQVIAELKAALRPDRRAMVDAVPLVVDDTPGDVNAFAACTGGKALMAITDGLLEITAQMARAKATDEVFRTNKWREYLQFLVQNRHATQVVARPAASFFDPMQDADGRKVQRQHQLFDEELGFVLGHELAHHYLGHTGCAGPQSAGLTPQDIGRVLSGAVPGFNQPNELASDIEGTTNTLNAGKTRADYKWTEGGAMLVLEFFLSLRQMSPAEAILFGFELSHPHPAFRIPAVQQTAASWRATGGATPVFPFPLQL